MASLIKVAGLREFTSKMRKLGADSLPKAIRAANLATSAQVASAVEAKAPRGTAAERDKHPGKLAASTKPLATQRMAKVSIGRGLVYAKPVIFGWPKHGIPKHDYPFEVLDEIRGEIPERYTKAVQAAITEAGL